MSCEVNMPGMKKRLHSVSLLTAMLVVCSLVPAGCSRQETPKKVSLYKRDSTTQLKAEQVKPNTLWFGFDLRLGPKEEVKIYTPFLRYLERATGRRFRISFTEKYEDTVDNLGKGVTHFASLGTLNYVIGASTYDIRYLVSSVNKEGDPAYQAVIFTAPDSSAESLKDLRGKCFAFGSKMSTQGHLIPRKMLEDEGVLIEDFTRVLYTGSHINAVKAVLNGECHAGGIQDTLATRLAAEGKIRIVTISPPYPSSVIAYNSAVDSRIVESVKAALLAFEPAGRDQGLLIDWDKTEMPLGFTSIDELELDRVKALAERYDILRR
jgi:phosphonate transport system substrate-binding protein